MAGEGTLEYVGVLGETSRGLAIPQWELGNRCVGLNPMAWPSPNPDLTQEWGAGGGAVTKGRLARPSCGFAEANLRNSQVLGENDQREGSSGGFLRGLPSGTAAPCPYPVTRQASGARVFLDSVSCAAAAPAGSVCSSSVDWGHQAVLI